MKIEAKVARGIREFSDGLDGIPTHRRAETTDPHPPKMKFLWFLRRAKPTRD